jgi:alkyl hydroperoxide reductase subunit AhpF
MQVKLLNDEISVRIKDLFTTQLANPIELNYFINKDQCESCEEANQLFEELANLSEKITLSTYDIEEHPQLAQRYNIQQTPALVICGREQDKSIDYGVRFLGIPSGYEFSSLIQAVGIVSRRDSGLKPDTRERLKALREPLSLKVFVTPT